jgi:CBS domain containing-hemolysin-like protein
MDSWSWPGLLAAATERGSGLTGTDWLLIVILFLALLSAATSAAAETAFTSVNRIRLRNLAEEGDLKAKRVVRLLEQPQVFLTSILVMSNVSVIVASTVATILAFKLSANWGEVISTVVLSLVVLIFCEITPKTAAVQSPERWARGLVGPVEALTTVLRFVVIGLTWLTAGIVRVFGGQNVRHGPFVTEEELRLLVEVGEEEGVLEEEEREMIHNVFELADTSVREVMVPRIDMVTVEADATVEEAMDLIVQGGQSRIPVYEDTIDNIIGVLYAKDLLRIFASHQHPPSVRSIVRPAYFVPESKRLDDLLRELQQQRVHIAIVVDEYGSVAGLVTIEDLVEEIIGDIQDEYDKEEQLFERISDYEYIVDAKISLDDFNELLDTDLTSEDYETLGGFVYSQLDKIPTVGDVVHHENLTITVLSTKGRRVTKVKVVRTVPANEGGEAEASVSGIRPLPAPADEALLLPPPASTADGAASPDRSSATVPGELPHTDTTPAETPPPEPDAGDESIALESGELPVETTAPRGEVRAGRGRTSLLRRHGHGSPQSRRR